MTSPLDTADLAAFCRAQYAGLVRALSLYCGDRDVAQELAQETIAIACRDWSKVKTADDPRAWLHRVGINLANSHFRRRKAERNAKQRLNLRRETAPAHPDPSPSEELRVAVAALPRRQKTAIILRYFLDLSIQETAHHMGCSEGTVKALTHQATRALRSHPGLMDLTETHDES